MPSCPMGHDSAATDFCDVCGVRIGSPPPDGVPAAAPPGTAPPGTARPDTAPVSTLPAVSVPTVPAGPDSAATPCPRCGTAGEGRFCESCGFDYASGTATSGTAAAPVTAAGVATWTAVVTADREYFDSVLAEGGPDAASLQFPAYCPQRQFRLSGTEMRIGRRSVSRGLEPEIDLAGPPADPGISHLHAVLMAEPGGWAILDPGSANGTQVNGSDIPSGVKVSLHPGDRVTVGAWTVLTFLAA